MSEAASRSAFGQRYLATRQHSMDLAAPLGVEDQAIQSMPDASPTKWHLAHTTWFFETFILSRYAPGHCWFDDAFQVLFNSYYNGIGEQHPRPRRGMLSRPGLEKVHAYRQYVDNAIEHLIGDCGDSDWPSIAELLVLGINHEQQHQELLLTDIKHALFQSPLLPAYLDCPRPPRTPCERRWRSYKGGRVSIGHQGAGFCFDNEQPRHETWLRPFQLADTPVTNREWLAFIEDGGYEQPMLWLSEGWAWRQAGAVSYPLYWLSPENDRGGDEAGGWRQYSLGGVRPLDQEDPVCHISYFEADAYARWADSRLPTEAEWETASNEYSGETVQGADRNAFDPAQEFHRTWEWTASAYLPYPGYRPAEGAVGEYNGKFMINQMVLRGASAATPPRHARLTYRNFFPASARWQFTGLRLARDEVDG